MDPISALFEVINWFLSLPVTAVEALLAWLEAWSL